VTKRKHISTANTSTTNTSATNTNTAYSVTTSTIRTNCATNKPAVPVTPKKSENSEDSPKTTQIRITKSLPKTGDTNSFAGLGVILIALSLSGLLLKRK
ncbi:LPXTG cell wall anchor domain-containing protein, partial [Listeria monocytogenes]|uniref:LPXTG cell wall anchor domain-containing protein n=1 Tax=Listeria monocytogenes TaxID=1639 RepID=UPI00273133BB